jgi:tetratricopeptide (TPR) repeat protein
MYLFQNAPCIQKRITYSGPYIIKKALRDTTYRSRFSGLVDTLLICHQKRIEFFGDEGYVKGKWADDMSKLQPKNRDKALSLFNESVQIQGNKTRYDVPSDYVYAGVKQYKKKKLTLDSLLMILDQVTPIIDANITKYTAPGLSVKDSLKGLKWGKTQNAIIGMLKPYLDCDKLTELKQPYFEENKGNSSWLASTVKLLDRGGCEGQQFYFQCAEELFKLVPNVNAAMSLAKAFGKKGDYSKSIEYYLKAAELSESDEDKFNIWIKLAKTAKNSGKYSSTRDYARKALAINSNSGEAYLLIGDAYAASASSCGTGDLGRGGVYLIAVDKYLKARSVDPSVAEASNVKISKYSAYFPEKEDAFFKNINNGDTYTVGCWIGESTIVRTIGG